MPAEPLGRAAPAAIQPSSCQSCAVAPQRFRRPPAPWMLHVAAGASPARGQALQEVLQTKVRAAGKAAAPPTPTPVPPTAQPCHSAVAATGAPAEA
eukprot:6891244-Alexandrium_andersonii.AAC.1